MKRSCIIFKSSEEPWMEAARRCISDEVKLDSEFKGPFQDVDINLGYEKMSFQGQHGWRRFLSRGWHRCCRSRVQAGGCF